MKTSATDIDDYIRAFPPDVQARLSRVRATIRSKAPDAVEKISYGLPTFHLNGNLIHFGAFAHHIGIYPTPSGIAEFQTELAAYKNSKGAVQFPHDQPLPLELIASIVEFRVARALQKEPKRRGS